MHASTGHNLLIAVIIVIGIASCEGKPYRLAMLAITQDNTAGGVKHYGQGCQAASRLLVDVVNNRSDILPNYHVDVDYQYEDNGNAVSRAAVRFSQGFQQGIRNGSFQSPFIFGPMISVACKVLGTFVHEINSFAISPVCGAEQLSDHSKYPDLYLNILSSQVIAPIAKFPMIMKWKRIAIFSTAKNPNDYDVALRLHRMAIANGIEVVRLDIIAMDVTDDTVASLKDSEARAIFIMTSDGGVLLSFFCKIYVAGITGPRYFFMINMLAMANPLTLPDPVMPGCSRQMVIEQMELSIWVFFTISGESLTIKSELGYTSKEFDKMLDGPDYLNKTRPGDYVLRCFCHDTMLRGLVALSDADKRLGETNMSLKDIGTSPDTVMKVVNESVLHSKAAGLRVNPMEFDQRGRTRYEYAEMYHFSMKEGLQLIFVTNRFSANDSLVSLDSYELKPVQPFAWPAWNGRIPRDGPNQIRQTYDVPNSFFISVLSLGSVLSLLQVINLTLVYRRYKVVKKKDRHFSRSKMVGLVGCILLNAAAVTFATRTVDAPYTIWTCRICVLVVSLTVTTGVTSFQMIAVRSCSLPGTAAANRRFRRGELTRILTGKLMLADGKNIRHTLRYLVAVSLIMFNVLVADPLDCKTQVVPYMTGYLFETDTHTITEGVSCTSKYSIIWQLIFVFCNMALFVTATLVYRSFKLNHNSKLFAELKYIGFALANGVILLVCTCLLLVTFQNNLVRQQVTVSIACLFLSGSSSAIWFHSISKRLRIGSTFA